jgi:hypothetical protein
MTLTKEQIKRWREWISEHPQQPPGATALCDMALASLEGVKVPISLAERTEAMFRSVDPDGVIAQEWKDVLAARPK